MVYFSSFLFSTETFGDFLKRMRESKDPIPRKKSRANEQSSILPKIILYGDSHVKRCEQAASGIALDVSLDFLGVPGLNICNWQSQYVLLREYDIIYVQGGGNDGSQHPRKPLDKPVSPQLIRDALKAMYAALAKDNPKVVLYITSALPRHSETVPTALNKVLYGGFRSHFLNLKSKMENDVLPNGFVDTVHKTTNTYRGILEEIAAHIKEVSLPEYAKKNK